MSALPVLLLAAALGAAPTPSSPPPPGPTPPAGQAAGDPWAPFLPLLGEWVAEPGSQPGETASGTASFAFDLDGRVLVRRNHVRLNPRAGEATGPVHDDLLVVAREGTGLRATYWDNEGHVIRYAVTSVAGAVTLESEPGPGPRFRLAYEARADGRYAVTFSIAMPGGEFRPYQSGLMRRRSS